MGTSPCTVTVLDSVLEPPPQAASDRTPAAARALAPPSRVRVDLIGSFMVSLFPWVLSSSASALEAGGVVQCALRIHDHRVDARVGLDEAQSLFDAKHENRLREGLRRQAVVGNDGHAAHAAGGAAGARVEQVVAADA